MSKEFIEKHVENFFIVKNEKLIQEKVQKSKLFSDSKNLNKIQIDSSLNENSVKIIDNCFVTVNENYFGIRPRRVILI
jgi:hypothetical protein